MENELRKEGARPPAHRGDGAGCCQQSGWVGLYAEDPLWRGVLGGGQEPPGEGGRQWGGMWGEGQNQKPGSDPQHPTCSSCDSQRATSAMEPQFSHP